MFKINDEDIHKAADVGEFMMRLYDVDKDRYNEATQNHMPHGDLAYGSALVDWIKKGRPKDAIFSYAEGEVECKLLLAFRKEISAKFGLPIMTREEAAEWRARQAKPIQDKKVVDWLN